MFLFVQFVGCKLVFINCTLDVQYSVMKEMLRLMYLTFIGPCIVILFL